MCLAIALTLFAGLLFGHRIGLNREKRREFNLIVEPIRDFLISSHVPQKKFPTLSIEQKTQILNVMSAIHRDAFEKSYDQYISSVNTGSTTDLNDDVNYLNADVIEKHFQKILSHLQPKSAA